MKQKKEKKEKKKRGLSLEDKRQIMLKMFKDDPTFFHYKDVEKYSTKNKISFMVVKEILKGLVGKILLLIFNSG
ncbi:MAG: hypothetical protein MJ252_17460 [archaeon]|nr:hypothetical protein [archaeon]